MMTLLRRRRLLAAVPISSEPAPFLGAPVDVCAGDDAAGVAGAHLPADVETDAAGIRAGVYRSSPDGLVEVDTPLRPRLSSRDLDDEPAAFSEGGQLGHTPPDYEPGVCHHPGHILWNGLRFGVTPCSADHIPNLAALVRCHHRRAELEEVGR